MKLTSSMKAAGELAIRQMSEKARTTYAGYEPYEVYEYDGENGKLYAVKDVDGTTYGMTFEQVQAGLEAFAE